ncbi:10353_t:CDS:2 [Dentiscutata erythropus]|uniref:10353_t:CDS:1 n=1 Tax=Dentiscutata erythropus TaxID=1348616 RepID=A0A9N9H823_9GLOM|nr:10353_t:CDS:2 [Dentiscutata erythropus]
MGLVNSKLNIKKKFIRIKSIKVKKLDNTSEVYDSDDSIDRLSVEDFAKEEYEGYGVCKIRQKGHIICSDNVEELDDEQLKIRKEFEEADKQIPDIATNAYAQMHPKTTWKSQYLNLPKFPDSQDHEHLEDIILFEHEEIKENHENHDTIKKIENIQN